MNSFPKNSVAQSLVVLSCALSGEALAADINPPEQTIIRSEAQTPVKGAENIFTGNVRVTPLYPANNAMRSSGGSVTFEAGARSNWHVHPVGQVLIVTAGTGRSQEWGKPMQEIRTGDVVICPTGVKHWHGAAPDSSMTHISICEEKEAGNVVQWLEKVSDAQYGGSR